jgi:thioredoxin 1
MASANVREFTDSNFQTEVLSSDKPVVVDFWAEWCGPCRALAPTIEQIADEMHDRVKVGKLNTDNNRDVAVKYQITAIPTVIIFKGGQPVTRIMGLRPKADFVAALESLK